MKRALALLTLAWLSSCFPDYDVVPSPTGAAGDTGTAPSCKDNERNGGETGIDCGMDACSKACPPGQGCVSDVDCDVGRCADKVCRAASCADGLQNSGETDKDCGGEQGCARCTVGQRCSGASDCDGGECASGQCRAPTCKDHLVNGDESDQDCGGDTCLPCDVGQTCDDTDDCDGVACSKGTCQPATCDDLLQNADETDKDCGGSCSTKCDTDLGCKLSADCDSRVCNASKKCAAATCDDGVVNGDEPSADCGGSCLNKCEQLAPCRTNDDCKTGSCVDQRCVPSVASGDVLSPLGWIATASDSIAIAPPPHAIDGLNDTDFNTGTDQTVGMWFQLDMRTEQIVFSIEIDCNNQNACLDNDPTKTDVAQAINIAFSDSDSFDDAPAIIMNRVIGPHEVIKLPKPQVGRYLRISLAQGKNRWWRMDEVRLKR